MIVYLNGRFVAEEQAMVPAFDRGFLYGDGLFEAVLLRNGNPFRWQAHMERLRRGAAMLRLKLPLDEAALLRVALELAQRNELPDATLRLQVSRGIGTRGYLPTGAESPTVLMSLHPAGEAPTSPRQIRLITSSLRVPVDDALAMLKTADKLRQIVARLEAEERGADEALLLNTNGEVGEATSANVFWIEAKALCTPPLKSSALAGVTREAILEIAPSLGLAVRENIGTPGTLRGADGVFLTVSSQGVMEVVALDGTDLKHSQAAADLFRAYWDLVACETQS